MSQCPPGLVEAALRERLIAFPLEAVQRLVKHAQAAEDHYSPYAGVPGVTADEGPALLWVKDHGTFLTSNGLPPLLEPGSTSQQVVVYALGCEPPTATPAQHGHADNGAAWSEVYERVWDLCGGDDFIEVIALDDEFLAMLDEAAEAAADGHTYLAISVEPQAFCVSMARLVPVASPEGPAAPG